MRIRIHYMCLGLFLLTLFSCGISKSGMEQGIKQSFQEKMDTDSSYKNYGMKVQKVVLVKSDSNSYDGFVTVLLEDETHDVSISVETDKSGYSWEPKPTAFAFLVQYRLKNLGRDWGW